MQTKQKIDAVPETVPEENNDTPSSKEEIDQEVTQSSPPPEKTQEEMPEKSGTIGEKNCSDALPTEKEDASSNAVEPPLFLTENKDKIIDDNLDKQ
eukprot:15346426-Ditylum_brightwellii.AAC.1